ncbi:MAG: methyl-accepting chemotaxis protein [Jannaschia sp.]
MGAYDPNFEIDLSPNLLRRADSGDAVRAALQLPALVRGHGARIAMFLGAAMLTRDPDMALGARDGLGRAMNGYDSIRTLLANWSGRQDLHPDACAIFDAVADSLPAAIRAMDTYRTVSGRARDAVEAGGMPDVEMFDETMRCAYSVFHPEMMVLTDRMTAAGVAIRRRLIEQARDAQDRSLNARERIDEIARTVRLISLNARVEAARAGTAGRTFGVIAEEIKALSEQTEEVSAELGQSVEDIMENFRIV